MSCRYPAMLPRRRTSAAPDMDLLNDKECITRPEKCYTKQVKRNLEDTHPFLHKSLSDIGWTEKGIIMVFHAIALENQRYVARRAERNRHSEHWFLKSNQDGPQQP